MTSPHLIPDIEADEGFRATAYPDPLSGTDPWTVGYGETGPHVTRGTTRTPEQAKAFVVTRTAALSESLAQTLDWYPELLDLRQDVLVNMAYNMGLHGLLAFHNTLTCVGAGDYAGAAKGMLASAWARQVHNRATRLSLQMETGTHA